MPIIINGKVINIPDNAKTISVINNTLFINGEAVEMSEHSKDGAKVFNIVINGNVESIDGSFGDISINGNVFSAKTISGDISVEGDVVGSIATVSGDISRN